MFFATLSGKNTDSALLLLNFREILMVTIVHHLHALKFVRAWHRKGILAELFDHFPSMLATYIIILTPGMRPRKNFTNSEQKQILASK